MAKRPIFVPILSGKIGVQERMLEFQWHPGMAITQKQKSIDSLHQSAQKEGLHPVLEISSKSKDPLGVNLSAFNLHMETKVLGRRISVESAFQGSKIFQQGGPFKDIYDLSPRDAKKDDRIRASGDIIGFDFFGQKFPNFPRTLFYDWLYINTLIQNATLAKQVLAYKAFSDIEFNPERSINCQAHSAALYLSIISFGESELRLKDPEYFMSITRDFYESQQRSYIIQSQIL